MKSQVGHHITSHLSGYTLKARMRMTLFMSTTQMTQLKHSSLFCKEEMWHLTEAAQKSKTLTYEIN